MAYFSETGAIDIRRAGLWAQPMLFSSPHSGRDYPPAFLEQSRLQQHDLRRSEDAWIDQLFDFAPDFGAPLLAARFPRCYADVNRDEKEIDPAMFWPRPEDISYPLPPRVKAGLGMLARVIAADMPIYRNRLPLKEYGMRRDSCYRPWHQALEGLLREGKQRFGGILLVDCHSMPSSVEAGSGGKMDIVLGDRYGAACHPGITDLFEDAFRSQGLHIRRNQPYAGGYITSHYGRPFQGRHAIQIEINRRLYLDQQRLELTPGFADLKTALIAAFDMIATRLNREWLRPGLDPDWQMADCAE